MSLKENILPTQQKITFLFHKQKLLKLFMILIKKAHFLNFVKSPRPVLRDRSSETGLLGLVLQDWSSPPRFELQYLDLSSMKVLEVME